MLLGTLIQLTAPTTQIGLSEVTKVPVRSPPLARHLQVSKRFIATCPV